MARHDVPTTYPDLGTNGSIAAVFTDLSDAILGIVPPKTAFVSLLRDWYVMQMRLYELLNEKMSQSLQIQADKDDLIVSNLPLDYPEYDPSLWPDS